MSEEQEVPLFLVQCEKSFYLDREASQLTPRTLEWYRKYVSTLVKWLAEHDVVALQDVTSSHLRKYLIDVQKRKLSAHTIHHHASAARTFFNFLVSEELLTESNNPMRRVRMPRLPKEILPALSAEDVTKLLKTRDNDRDRAIVLFLVDTGVRISEFVALDVKDVDTGQGSVMVRSGKGRKDRIVFLGVRSRRALLRYPITRRPEPDDPLWLSLTSHERITHWGLRLMLKRLGERTGVEHSNPHTFRRTFAIWSLRAGMDLVRLAALMGHNDLETLRRYLAYTETDLENAVRQFGAVDSTLSKR